LGLNAFKSVHVFIIIARAESGRRRIGKHSLSHQLSRCRQECGREPTGQHRTLPLTPHLCTTPTLLASCLLHLIKQRAEHIVIRARHLRRNLEHRVCIRTPSRLHPASLICCPTEYCRMMTKTQYLRACSTKFSTPLKRLPRSITKGATLIRNSVLFVMKL